MSEKLKDLRTKARSISSTLAALPAKQKDRQPEASYGEDYNTLHNMVLDEFPDKKDVMPPLITFTIEAQGRVRVCQQSFVHIQTWATQILGILPTEND